VRNEKCGKVSFLKIKSTNSLNVKKKANYIFSSKRSACQYSRLNFFFNLYPKADE
jgi:hypothetical protein